MTVGSIVFHIGGSGGGDGMTGIQGLTLPEKSVEDFERSWRRVELIASANQWNEEKKLAVIPALLRGKLLDFYAVLTSEERSDLETEVMKQKNSGMIRHKRYWNKLLSGWKHWNQDWFVPTQQASRRCYNCNEEGHYCRNCPHVERSDSSQMRKKKAQEQFKVTNTGHSETTLYKGTQIGIFSIKHCVMALDSESAGPVLDDKLPEIDLSNTDLTTEQSVELQKIWEFRAGKAPKEASHFLAGATLVALPKLKPNCPPDVRPIAVGEVLRQLTGKCLCQLLKNKAMEFFLPYQFGVACLNGAEK
eukprot:Em0003g15a